MILTVLLIGFRRYPDTLLLERYPDQDLSSATIPSHIWSGQEIPPCALAFCLFRCWMVDCNDRPGISGLHPFCLQLGQENLGALCRPGQILQMERNLQLGPGLSHPSAARINGVAVEYLCKT